MPLLHCNKCQHEYEAATKEVPCRECGSTGYVLEEKTSLERMLESDWFKKGEFLPKDLKI